MVLLCVTSVKEEVVVVVTLCGDSCIADNQ